MNKAQLIEKVAELTSTTKQQSEAFLDATLEVIQNAVCSGDEVKLVGFGNFCSAERQARAGRNPKTGVTVQIPGSRVPRFKPGKDFKDQVNLSKSVSKKSSSKSAKATTKKNSQPTAERDRL